MTFRAASTLLCLSLSALHAQSELHTPRAAVVRYQSGALHSLYGLGSSYVVSRSPAGSAAASVFSDHFGLTADGASLSLLDEEFSVIARISCTDAKPVLSIEDAANSALAWLPSQSAVMIFDGHEFVSITVSGMVSTSLVTAVSKLNDSTVRLLQTQADGSVFEHLISIGSGQVTSAKLVADAHGVAALFLGSVVSSYDGKLHASAPDGNIPSFELPFEATAITFEQCSSRGLHIASSIDARNWIFYRENNRLVLAELPAVPQ